MCQEHCEGLGATFMATQFGYECWCSDDIDLDYERHHYSDCADAVCDMVCQGNTVSPQRTAMAPPLALPYRSGVLSPSKAQRQDVIHIALLPWQL